MIDNKPLVSVIIPAYNVAMYIEEAVNSIFNQTYRNLEIIVIDDGSSDGTHDILLKLAKVDNRLIVKRNSENMKIVGTLNKGIKLSRGKYIARMDGDDYKYPDAIEAQVAYMEKNPKTVIVGGAIDICDQHMTISNRRQYPITDEDIRKKIFRYNPFAHPAILIRKTALEHELYELNWAEDYDIYFRLGRIGKFANLEQSLLKLRTHKQSVSQSKLEYQENLTLFIRLKAVFEYGYVMSFGDKLYFSLQLLSKYLMPTRIKFKLFNKLRSLRK